MRRIGSKLLLVVLVALSLAAGIMLQRWTGKDPTFEPPIPKNEISKVNAELGMPLPAFAFTDLSGNYRHHYEWAGKPLLINFWASWCPPCVREIPAFEEIYQDHKKQALVVLGIALDDPKNINEFLQKHNISYPVLYGEADVGDLMLQLGNNIGGLPYTVGFDRNGKLAAVAPLGELDYEQISALVDKVLR